jgi:adenosylcobinamide kinase / adenosylcobinamide-phosphate guanylyltransferase
MRELILGGQKSGKSRAAEERALSWLSVSGHRAALLATAEALDEEMSARIERHRRDRALRVPALRTVEASGDLAQAIASHAAPETLLVVDCLTLWLTQRVMPLRALHAIAAVELAGQTDALLEALAATPGPVVLVSNEIGLGVVPMDAASRGFVDALGVLHQRVAAVCERVTLMVAGCELAVKGTR